MRKSLALVIAVSFFALALMSIPSCDSRETPRKLDISGVRITVWDALQPEFPGSSDYSREVSRVVEDFCRETGATVDFKYAERREVMAVLSGASPGEDGGSGLGSASDPAPVSPGRPHLMFSSEWPVVSDVLADVSGELDVTAYIDPAGTYWTRGDEILGIPAYIQWIGTAVRNCPIEEGNTAYWVDSPAFFRAALDKPEAGWNEETLLQYANWVKDKYGSFRDDPLMEWQNGTVDALYPTTPYLLRWLKASSGAIQGNVEPEGEAAKSSTTIVPASSPFGGDFYYTVPAYLVLTEDAPLKAAAAELGKRLAANLGRWATRTLACVPALVNDVPIFHLESGLPYEERQVIWESIRAGTRPAPSAEEFIQASSLDSVMAPTFADFLRGEATTDRLEESIRSAGLRNTKP